MGCFIAKLKCLKMGLKDWKINIFGDVNKNLSEAMNHLSNVQLDISMNGVSDEALDSEVQARNVVDTLLSFQDSLYKEKSRVKWLADSDRNLAFFHALLKRRRVSNGLNKIKIGDVLIDDHNVIKNHVTSFFHDLFP